MVKTRPPKKSVKLFAEGSRSKEHRLENGYSDSIIYQGAEYKICNGSVDFVNERCIISLGTGREAIVLDADSSGMRAIYNEFMQFLVHEPPTLPGLFSQAIDFINKQFTTTDFNLSSHYGTIKLGKHDSINLPTFPLSDIFNKGKGECRHHALALAFLISSYIRAHNINDVSVHVCRDNLEEGAHAWVVCNHKNNLFLVDSLWKRLFELTSHRPYLAACLVYTKEVIHQTLTRAHLDPPLASTIKNSPSDDEMTINERLGQAIDNWLTPARYLPSRRQNVIMALINEGANINTQGSHSGWTITHLATLTANTDLLKLLIEKGADLNIKSFYSARSPLFYAKRREDVILLLRHGANPLLQDNTHKNNPAYMTLVKMEIITLNDLLNIELDKRGKADSSYINLLILNGANLNTKGSKTGWTVAHVMLKKNDLKTLAQLSQYHINVNAKSLKTGRSPLFYAQSREAVDWLLQKGANPLQVTNKGNPAYEVMIKKKFHKSNGILGYYGLKIQNDTLVYAACNGDKAQVSKMQLLFTMRLFIKQEVSRLSPDTNQLAKDKKNLYLLLKQDIKDAIINTIVPDMANMINQLAMISHHRLNHHSFNLFHKRTASWDAYHQFVAKAAGQYDVSLQKRLCDSLRIKKDKMTCTIQTAEDNSLKTVNNYKDYRDALLNAPVLTKSQSCEFGNSW